MFCLTTARVSLVQSLPSEREVRAVRQRREAMPRWRTWILKKLENFPFHKDAISYRFPTAAAQVKFLQACKLAELSVEVVPQNLWFVFSESKEFGFCCTLGRVERSRLRSRG